MLSFSNVAPGLRVAVYRSSSIGDVVLATSCLDLLDRLEIPVDVTWLGRSPSLELVSAAWPSIRPVEVKRPSDGAGKTDVLNSLRDVDFIVDLQTSLRSRALCLQARREFGVSSYTCEKNTVDRGRMVLAARLRGRARTMPPPLPVLQHQLMTQALLNALTIHLPGCLTENLLGCVARPRLNTAHDSMQSPWQKELKFGRWLAIAPGAMYETKRAPLNLFTGILDELRRGWKLGEGDSGQGVGLVLLGDDRDRDLATELLDSIHWPFSVLNLAGKLSLWESALALKEATCLLGNDSALCHIAEAVGTPVASLFGPTSESFGFAPWRTSSHAFSASLGCRPCSKHGSTTCRYGDVLCFQMIGGQDVAQHIKDLFSSDESAE